MSSLGVFTQALDAIGDKIATWSVDKILTVRATFFASRANHPLSPVNTIDTVIGSKFSRNFFNQSEVKPKPIVAHACTFSLALCRLSVTSLSFNWSTGLSPFFMKSKSNYFGFGFTTLG